MCGDIETCPGPERDIPELKRLLCQKGLNILHQNVRGLLSNKVYLCELFQSFFMSETHTTEQDPNGLFDIPGYSFTSRTRTTGIGGGVAAYISDEIQWKRRNDLENKNIESIWIEIQPNYAKSFLICILYRPPDSSKQLNHNFNKEFDEMLSLASKECKETIILGDVNVNFLVPRDNKEFHIKSSWPKTNH
jgi:exonuclease III